MHRKQRPPCRSPAWDESPFKISSWALVFNNLTVMCSGVSLFGQTLPGAHWIFMICILNASHQIGGTLVIISLNISCPFISLSFKDSHKDDRCATRCNIYLRLGWMILSNNKENLSDWIKTTRCNCILSVRDVFLIQNPAVWNQ